MTTTSSIVFRERRPIQRPIFVVAMWRLWGRPNVGKSTLLNHVLGQKLSITSRKPQTTRHRILGIVTKEKSQAVYVDTPGIHGEERKAINRYMNRAATSALNDVDLVLFVVDGLKWTPDDELVMEKIRKVSVPVMLLINKVDTIEDKEALLPRINELVATYGFVEVVPLSALKGHNVDRLQELVGGKPAIFTTVLWRGPDHGSLVALFWRPRRSVRKSCGSWVTRSPMKSRWKLKSSSRRASSVVSAP
jgi:small GTP-binding protein